MYLDQRNAAIQLVYNAMSRVTRSKASAPTKEVIAKNCYFAEAVIEERPGKDGEPRYLVKWEGYPPEGSTWEPYENLSTLLFTNWIIDRWELEEIIKEVDGEETTRETRPISSILYSCAISEDIENVLFVWARGGNITY
jgi:hypothetical protein